MAFFDCAWTVEAKIVVFDLVRGGGCGERSASIFELWVAPPWPVGFSVTLENSDGAPLGVAVFRMTQRTRHFRGQELKLYELSQLLSPGSESDYPTARLTAFAAQLS